MLRESFVIGVTGGTASGKTSLCEIVMEEIGKKYCSLITMDSFYKPLSPEDRKNCANYNFDHPKALDFEMIRKCLESISKGHDVDIPIYDFKTHSRTGVQKIPFAPVIIFEGILSFYAEDIRKLFDLKIFVNTDDDLRLGRRLRRDVSERGRTIESVLIQYNKHVKRAYDDFIKPMMKYADIVVPFGRMNKVAIEFLVDNIKIQLKKLGFPKIPYTRINLDISDVKLQKLHKIIACDTDLPDLNEILAKFVFEKDQSLNSILVSFLTNKLMSLLKGLNKTKMFLFPISEFTEEKGKILAEEIKKGNTIVYYRHAILGDETVSVLQKCIEGIKAIDKKAEVKVVTYYTSLLSLNKLPSCDDVTIYTVYCYDGLDTIINRIENADGKSKFPPPKLYLDKFNATLSSELTK